MENKTFRLAEFLATLKIDEIPSPARDKAKEKILDGIGLMVAGRDTFESHCLDKILKNPFNTHKEKRLKELGQDSILQSVWVNAASAYVWNAADTSPMTLAHCEAVVIPVAIAVGRALGSSGPDVMTAVVAGYEAMERVARTVDHARSRGHLKRGFNSTGTCGVFGSVAAAGKLLNLTEGQLFDAMGIAGNFASGLMGAGQIAGKHSVIWLLAGKAAYSGLIAMNLALEGFSGPQAGLEGRDCFLSAYSDQAAGYEGNWLTNDFGQPFLIEQCETKLYSTAHTLRPAIDALLELRSQNQISPEEVVKVEVGIPKLFASISEGRPSHPDCFTKAQSSYPYALAVALHHGEVLPDEFSPLMLSTPGVLKTADRVQLLVDPDMDRELESGNWPSWVAITLAKGRHLKMVKLNPRGSAASPCNREDVEKKVKSLLASRLPEIRIRQLIKDVWRLEEIANIAEVTEFLGL